MSVAANPKRRVWRWLLSLLCLVIAWLAFKLFEPLFTWSTGWQQLPTAAAPQVRAADQDWANVAAKADEQLRESRARLQAPAMSAAVMIDGQRVWASAVGFADLPNAQPVQLDSRFRIGSSSKALNALALGRLIDAGKIDIDRSVRAYVPDLPPAYDPVTTRLAISHTAGVPDYGLCLCFPIWEHRNRRHFDGVRAALHVFEDEPLLFAPGTSFKYSSYGANVAGAAIESASGRPYLDWLQEGVFAPLHMQHTRADLNGAKDPQRVGFYEITEGRYKPADFVDNSVRYPSGGMLSTPSDMLAAGNAFLRPGLLSDATRTKLLSHQPLRDGSKNPQGYALGIRVADDKMLFEDTLRTTIYSHHGVSVGSTSYFAVYPEYGLVVSVMMNKGQETAEALTKESTRLVETFVAEQLRRRKAAAQPPAVVGQSKRSRNSSSPIAWGSP